MTDAATDRARVLQLLTHRQGDALTVGELREQGVGHPGQAIYELELAGYPIERVARMGYRLRTADEAGDTGEQRRAAR